MAPRFKKDDVLEVITWDGGDEQWEAAILQITEVNFNTTPNGYYSYSTTILSSCLGFKSIGWIEVSSEYLDRKSFSRYIGNMKEDKTLKVLYGSKDK